MNSENGFESLERPNLNDILDVIHKDIRIEDILTINDIWFLGYQLTSTKTKPTSKKEEIAVLASQTLTNSCVINTSFINKFGKLYRELISSPEIKGIDELESLIKDTEFVNIKERVEKHLTFTGIVLNEYVARVNQFEYLIDQNGELRRNLVFLDSWFTSEKDLNQLKKFYLDGVKKVLPKEGNVVFINRKKSPRGTILIKEHIKSELSGYGIIVIDEDLDLSIEKESSCKDYCILYDTLLNGKISDIFSEEIKHILLSKYNFKGNIAIFNEKNIISSYLFGNRDMPFYVSDHYDRDSKTESYITAEAHIDLLRRYPKEYTHKTHSTLLEDLVFGFVCNLSLGDEELTNKAEKLVQRGVKKIRKFFYESRNY